MAPKKRRHKRNIISRKQCETKQSDFKCRSEDVLDKNDEQCQRELEDLSVKGNLMISEKTATQSHVTNVLTEVAEDISSASQIEPESYSSKSYKTYKSQLQLNTKYLWSNNPVHNEDSEPKETPTLHDSSQDSGQCNPAASLVSAKIDISEKHDRFLLSGYIQSPYEKSENSEQFGQVSLVSRKRSNEEPPTRSSKKAKADDEGNVANQARRPSQIPNLSFEFSDDEEVENFMNGNTKKLAIYSCKHCDYSEVNITRMVSHYDNNHPYVRYKPTYIQDPCDQSATFRCLECPVEFLNVPELRRHYMESHPDHPGFHTTSSELRLVYKCFVCSYTSVKLGDLKTHYMEMHPTYTIGNTLKYCRYALSSSHLCPSDDMKLGFSDSELPGPERKKTEDIRNSSSPKCPTSTLSPGNECHKSTIQSASITPTATLQIPSHDSLELVTCDNISNFPKETEREETEVFRSLLNPQHPPEAMKLNAEHKNQDSNTMRPPGEISKAKQSPTKHHEDSVSNVTSKDLYYCKCCTFSSPCLRSVVGHHNSKHAEHCSINTKEVKSYSSRLKKLQNKMDPVKTSASERRKQVSRREVQVQKMNKGSHASVARLNPYSCAESLFYCQVCNFGSPSPLGVIIHQVSSHPNRIASLDRVKKHTVLMHEEIQKSKWINASFSRNLPLPIMCKNEKQVFFCHICNYRRRTLQQVLHHCSLSHRGVVVTRKEVERYTSMVLRRRRESIQRTKRQKPQGKEKVLSTKSDFEKDTAVVTKRQRSLQCCKCPFNTQLVTDLKRHVLEKHNSKCSSSDILGKCFKQGTIQAGYHCDLCVFSHTQAEAVYKHFQEKHPDQKITLNYVNTQLHAGPKSLSPKKKKGKEAFLRFHAYQIPLEFEASPSSTDTSRCMKNKGLTRDHGYVCIVCSQICATPRELNRHCDRAHPRSEVSSGVNDKSKLGLKVSLSNDLNRYIKSASKSQKCFYTCGLCLKFYFTRKDLGEHYVGEHGKEASEINSLPSSIPDSTGTQQNASETCNFASPAAEKKLVYKCPNCPYVNASNSGTLAHCRIKHPRLGTKRCKFQMDEVNTADIVNFQTVGMDSFIRGYACGECPQIHVSLKTLRIHYDLEHSRVKPEVSEHLRGTDFQPECSRDFVPEAISSPSANNSEMCPSQGLAKVKSDHMECKVCPNLTFDSAQHLISHYNALHFSDRMYDFIMLASEADSSRLYRCSFCRKQVHGIPQLHHHLDQHRSTGQAVRSADKKVSDVDPPRVEPAKQPTVQAYLPVLETVEDLARWNETPGETFSAPSSSPSLLIKPSDVEEPELDPEKEPLICKYYVTVEPVETDNQAKEQTEECPISSNEASNASALDGEAAVTEESLSSEPPDIQQQLNQTSLKSGGHAVSEANWEEGRCEEETLTSKDYSFMTVLSKTLKAHIETSHSACLSKPNPLTEFHCPFCPSQAENKNDLIDHISSHREECGVPREAQYPKLSHDLLGTFTIAPVDNLHLLVLKQEELQPYRCRLCYFDCDQLRDLQAHLTEKHQVIRNHELVSELVVDQQEAGFCRVSGENWSDTKDHKYENLVVEMRNSKVRSQGEDGIGEDRQQIDDPSGKYIHEEFPLKISLLDLQNKHEKLDGGRGCGTENTQQIEKVEASEEAQVNQICIGPLKQRTLEKSDPNLPLYKKDKDISGSEFMAVRSTATSEYKTRLRPKTTLPAEETNQDQPLGGKRSLSFLSSSGGHQIIRNKTPGSSFSPSRKKPLDNPRKEEGKTGKGTPQEKSQHIYVKNRLSTGTSEVKHFACDLCGRNLMSSHDLQRHVSLHGL